MAEGTYEYECMRAELLGLDKPDYEEFLKKQEDKQKEIQEVVEEDVDTENLKEADQQNEGMRNISGGLDELNNILQVTQRKINRFKASCGSLTNLLKIKIGHSSGENTPTTTNPEEDGTSIEPDSKMVTDSNNVENEVAQNGTPVRKSDLASAFDCQFDRLDSLIDKAENAQYSMKHQNKQMKKFLN